MDGKTDCHAAFAERSEEDVGDRAVQTGSAIKS
jgi:hypothetical protein